MTDQISPDDNPDNNPEPASFVDRVRNLPNRLIALIALGLVLAILGFSGVLTSSRDVEITRDEAIEIAREHIDFEAERAEARIFRQGPRLDPVWGVSFSVPAEGNPRDFEELATVELDAKTGEVIRISVEG